MSSEFQVQILNNNDVKKFCVTDWYQMSSAIQSLEENGIIPSLLLTSITNISKFEFINSIFDAYFEAKVRAKSSPVISTCFRQQGH